MVSRAESLTNPIEQVLEPMERMSEVLFGLIMVLTFTCSFSVAEAGREEVRTMLIGTLGCNLAWGIIDATFYLIACFCEQGRGILRLRAVHTIADREAVYRVIAGSLPPLVASVLSPADFEAMRQRLSQLPEPPNHLALSRNAWLGALGVFLIVFLATAPVVLPFTFVGDTRLALRMSNAVAIVLLFLVGYRLGRHAGYYPWRTGIVIVILGSAMVGITICLGG